jgi:hypothetical protein
MCLTGGITIEEICEIETGVDSQNRVAPKGENSSYSNNS